jgi:hypothetical protein
MLVTAILTDQSARALGISSHQNPVLCSRPFRVVALLVLSGCGGLALAEEPALTPDAPPPDLRVLKSGLRKNLLSAALPEMKAYRAALLALEQKQAAAQDFAGAVKSRDERIKVEKQIAVLEQEAAILASRPAVENAARVAARIELKLSEADLIGTRIDPTDGAITGWDQQDASATWQLPGLPPGGYEVMVRCTGPAGEVIIKESFYSLTTSCKASNDKSIEQNLGTIRIREGGGILKLMPVPPQKDSGWRVYSVVLVPAAI